VWVKLVMGGLWDREGVIESKVRGGREAMEGWSEGRLERSDCSTNHSIITNHPSLVASLLAQPQGFDDRVRAIARRYLS